MSNKIAEQTKLPTAFTLKAIATGIIVILVANALITFQVVPNYQWLGYTYPSHFYYDWIMSAAMPFLNGFAFGFISMMFIALINWVKKKPFFSRQETVIVLFMVIFGVGISTLEGRWKLYEGFYNGAIDVSLGLYDEQTVENIMTYGPWPLLYDVDYWKMVGPTSTFFVNWIVELPKIAWVSSFILSWTFLVYFFMLLFRRNMVNIEELAFPHGELATEMVELIPQEEASGKVGLFKSKWFLIFFAIQSIWLFLSILIGMLQTTDPNARVGGENVPLPFYPRIDLQFYIATWVELLLFLEPWQIGWYSLLPMDVLIGFFVGWLAFWVIYPEALTIMGYWERPTTLAGQGMSYVRMNLNVFSNGVSPNIYTVSIGLIIGMSVMTIIRGRHTLAAAFKSVVKEPEPEFDPERPVSYRMTLLLFIVSLLLFLGTCAAANISLQYAIVMVLIDLFLMIGAIRYAAESGAWFGYVGGGFWGWIFMVDAFMAVMLPWVYMGLNQTNVATLFIAEQGSGPWGIWVTVPTIVTFGLAAYMTAKNTKIRSKDIFKAFILAAVVGVVATGAFRIFWAHVWNTLQLSSLGLAGGAGGGINSAIGRSQRGSPEWAMFWNVWYQVSQFQTYTTDFIVKLAIGIAIPLILPILRRKWTWIRVSVAGIALGVIVGSWASLAPIFALIIKYIVLKIGGTALYREKLMPAAVGSIMGMLINLIIWLPIYDNIWTILNVPFTSPP